MHAVGCVRACPDWRCSPLRAPPSSPYISVPPHWTPPFTQKVKEREGCHGSPALYKTCVLRRCRNRDWLGWTSSFWWGWGGGGKFLGSWTTTTNILQGIGLDCTTSMLTAVVLSGCYKFGHLIFWGGIFWGGISAAPSPPKTQEIIIFRSVPLQTISFPVPSPKVTERGWW